MLIFDFDGRSTANDDAELEMAASRVYEPDNSNHIQLSNNELGAYPLLFAFVKSQIAVVYFFPSDSSAGFLSQNGSVDVSTIDFFENKEGAIITLATSAVIPKNAWIQAAKEFYRTNSMPTCLQWLEL